MDAGAAGDQLDAADARGDAAARDAGSLSSARAGAGAGGSAAGAGATPRCGDGAVSKGERCDTAIAPGKQGACPASCPAPDDSCKRLELRGVRCDAHCAEATITAREGGDGCCPSGAHHADDSDCEAQCGDGRVEDGELCERDGEPRCPESCDDGQLCTEDLRSGSEDRCDVKCTHVARAVGVADQCCPVGASSISDPDCGVLCGNGVREAGEECDDGNTKDGDGCDSHCAEERSQTCDNLGAGDLCSLCTCAQCGGRSGGCSSLFGAERVQNCLAVSNCIREQRCDVVECYCGSNLNSCLAGMPSGPCQAEIVRAVGSSDVAEIVAELRDERAPLARALRQSECEARQCASVCANR